MGVVYGLLLLNLLVLVHELGHFLFAKWIGVRIEAFSIGFGPKLFKKKFGETEYSVSLLLFGGYVKMTGQDDLKPSEADNDPRSYLNQPIIKRIGIALAGPLSNYALALLVLTFLYATGIHESPVQPPVVGHVADSSRGLAAGIRAGDTLLALNGRAPADWDAALMEFALNPEKEIAVTVGRADGRPVVGLTPEKTGREGMGVAGLYPSRKVVLGVVLSGSPAERAGLLKGDTVLAADGEPVPGWDFLVDRILDADSQAVSLTLKRGYDTLELPVRPEYNAEQKRPMIGIQRASVLVLNRYSPLRSIDKAFRHTGRDALMIFRFLKSLVTTRLSVKGMAGPVGIVHISGEVVKGGLEALLLFLAMISVNLMVVNLFPFLIISDGGVIFFLLIEAVRGRPLPVRVQTAIQQTAIFALIGLAVLLTWNDLARLLGAP